MTDIIRHVHNILDLCEMKHEIDGGIIRMKCSEKKLRANAYALVGSGVIVYKTARGLFTIVEMA